jgi:2-polyprenyl-3-methyl-5-hydroxy-6-metoxy-1,4-benzoquinol methylase
MTAAPIETASPRCLACGSSLSEAWATAHDIEYHTTSDAFTYRNCKACGVLFIDPVPESRLSEIYPSNYYSYKAPSRSPVTAVKTFLDRRFFRSILKRLDKTELRVLDVGGGAGWELLALRESDARVKNTQVVDLDPGAQQLALANGHEYFCGRVEDFETTQRFDLILLLNLIEHVRDPRQVLSKAKKLLAPGGLIVIKTPNWEALDAKVFRNASWAGLHCPRHWVLFTLESFAALAQGVGLAVHSANYTQGAPFWAASTLAWLAERKLARVSRERPVVYHPAFGLLAAAFAALDFLRRPFARTSQMFFLLGHAPNTP